MERDANLLYTKEMSKIFIAANANRILIEYLLRSSPIMNSQAESQHVVCLVKPDSGISGGLSENAEPAWRAVCMHPDIYMCKLGVRSSAPVFHGKPSELGQTYPQDIRYCAAGISDRLVCNTAHTSPELLQAASKAGLTPLHVRQGYAKCSLATVTETAAITADVGIYKAIRREAPEIDILLIRPGFVKLSGFPYGFIGGASGRVGDEMIFSGNLAAHPDFEEIRCFVEEHGVRLKYFAEYELTDIGSIIEEI